MPQPKQKILFIINPFSGSNKKEGLPTLIKNYLDHSKFEYDVIITKRSNHATEITKKAIENGYEIVAACGGDGTVNEVAKALVNTNAKLAIIPSGSGNGFAMHIGYGRNAKNAILKINNAVPRRIDSCSVNGSFYLNLAGVGFDALIAYKAHQGVNRGFSMYFKLVMKELLSFKAEKFQVTIEEENPFEDEFTTIAVANAAMYGYSFTVAPLADMTDGMLDVVFVKKASIFRTLLSSWRMLNNTLHKSSLVKVKKCKYFKIKAEKPYYFHIDGESFEFTDELKFQINPKSINVLFPN